jgi:hypothetical protein
MKRATALLAAAVAGAALAVAGCGSSGPSAYLASNSTEIVYISWQPDSSGNGIQGSLIEDTVSGTAPSETVSVVNDPITGSVNGNSVTIHVPEFLGYGPTLDGTLSAIRSPSTPSRRGGAFNRARSPWPARPTTTQRSRP